jgi:sporulation protein YlmC with PRC-barrel domain
MQKNNRRHKSVVAAVATASVLSLGFTPVFAQQKQESPEHQKANMDKLLSADSLKGTRVMDRQNRQLGTISDIFIDPATGKIQRADIDFNRESVGADREYSVAWDKVSLNREGDEVVATLDRSIVDRLRNGQEQAGNEQMSSSESAYNIQPQRDEEVPVANLSSHGISKIQQQLNKQGFDAGHVNGQWNQATQTAIRNFQRSNGLRTTGTLDKKTIDELGLDLDQLRADQSNRSGAVMGQADTSMNR